MVRGLGTAIVVSVFLTACGHSNSSADQSGFGAFPSPTASSSTNSSTGTDSWAPFDPNATQSPSDPIDSNAANSALGSQAPSLLNDVHAVSNAQSPSDVVAPIQDALNTFAGYAKNDPAVAQKLGDLTNQMNQAMKAMPKNPSKQQMQNLATYLQNLLKQFINWLIQHLTG